MIIIEKSFSVLQEMEGNNCSQDIGVNNTSPTGIGFDLYVRDCNFQFGFVAGEQFTVKNKLNIYLFTYI